MTTSTTLQRRLPAAIAVVVLPLTALVGCGQAEQAARASVETELRQAGDHLLDSESTSVVLSFDDPQGSAKRAATDGADALSAEVADVLLGGRISVTLDPASGTIRQLQAADPATPPAEALQLLNLAITVDVGGGPLAQLRLVGGDLYASADLDRVGDIAGAGQPDLATKIDGFAAQLPPEVQPAFTALQDGTWLKLPLAPYTDALGGLAPPPAAGAPTPAPEQLAGDLLAAVRPFVEVTDAGGDGDERVLDVQVQVRQALTALLDAITAAGVVPGLDQLPAGSVEGIGEGTANGQVVLEDSHLKKITVDLASVVSLTPPSPDTPDLAGSTLTVTVDDAADEVQVPEDVSPVDLAQLADAFVGGAAPA